MLDREPFLRAIFAAPDDDVPRLVFADYLDDHGDPTWAELLRVQCELARLPADTHDRRVVLMARGDELSHRMESHIEGDAYDRGFRVVTSILTTAEELADPDRFRLGAATHHPEWYGAVQLKVTGGRIVTPVPLATILTNPVTGNVTDLDLSGREEELPHEVEGVRVFDVELKPVIAVPMVEHLARMREARRLTVLDLRNNDLDNDALHALTQSTNLIRLRRLRLSAGNRFRGRVWARLRERFGDDVVE